MALQGTLDTFALPDVLRLLGATKKSGRLRITSDRGAGSVSVSSGAVCAVEATHAPLATEAVDALFELLRFREGSFAFDPDEAPENAGPDVDVESLLAGAEALLAEWREIEAVVPSLDAHARLRRTLDGPSVSITAEQWTTRVAVGGGATVGAIGDALQLAELPVSRALRDLAELGVVDIEAAAPAGPAAPPADEAAVPSPLETEPVGPVTARPTIDLDEAVPADVPPPPPPASEPTAAEPGDELPVARPLRARRSKAPQAERDEPAEPERFVPLELPGHMTSAPAEPEPEPPADVAVDDLAAAFPGLANRTVATPEDEELARQLATLSPRAADAVRAAAEAATEEERDAALDEATDESDGSINRGLLLKFLSSVKS